VLPALKILQQREGYVKGTANTRRLELQRGNIVKGMQLTVHKQDS